VKDVPPIEKVPIPWAGEKERRGKRFFAEQEKS